MGSTESKQESVKLVGPAPAPVGKASVASTPKFITSGSNVNLPKQKKQAFDNPDIEMYTRLRDDLLAFSLGQAAYDYAKRLLDDQPDNPALQALVGETVLLYDRQKVKRLREHWCDRTDLMQEG